jgi:hypothetical protein
MTLEARVNRKMRSTGLPRAEATKAVLAEVAELEKRLGRPVLTDADRRRVIPAVRIAPDHVKAPEPDGPAKVADRVRHEYTVDLAIHRRKQKIRRIGVLLVGAALIAIVAAAFVLLASRAVANGSPWLEAPMPEGCTSNPDGSVVCHDEEGGWFFEAP